MTSFTEEECDEMGLLSYAQGIADTAVTALNGGEDVLSLVNSVMRDGLPLARCDRDLLAGIFYALKTGDIGADEAAQAFAQAAADVR